MTPLSGIGGAVDSTFDLLTLSLLPGVTPRVARELALRASLADALARPDDHADLVGPAARALLRTGEARRRAQDELRAVAALGARLIGRDEPDYPHLLRHVYDPPPVLYLLGDVAEGEDGHSVAVIGSRAATPQGATLARDMARQLAAAGLTIVSGLARGIDTAAHQGALEGGGRTLAILGSGLDRLYPVDNARLARAVAGQGAVVTEFPLGTTPLPGHFPRRNRIIAGWGRAVVVVEAAQRSGALVTARCALEEGREVMAVPGHPSAPGSAGTNALIRDGALLVRGAADVAEALGVTLAATEGGTDEAADPVFAALRTDAPRSVEDVQRRSGRSASEVLGRLTELELASRVRRLPGALFVRA
ncbi:MAG TPA: DNA-processing protein DprA [Vicinamibacteria bacterium]|nr:DNA-processing protein DprA [Vicinamibacteria bacterium]